MMRKMKEATKIISLLMVFLFLGSLCYGNNTSRPVIESTSDERPAYTPTTIPSQETTNGTHVWWEQSDYEYNETWDSSNRNWLFGPTFEYVITFDDGTMFNLENDYAHYGEKLRFNVRIPKDLFSKGVGMEEVRMSGWLTIDDFNANFDFGWRPNDAYEEWFVYTSKSNSSGYPEDTFLDIYSGECSNSSDDFNYYVFFVVSFNNKAPQGLFDIGLSISDSEWNYFDSRWKAGFDGNKQDLLAVGIHPDDAFKYIYDSSYTLQKLDLEGDELFSVSRGKDFSMRFNITGNTPALVKLWFNIPGWMDAEVNITDWHYELVTEYGGWVYDEISKTYIWDESVPVTYSKYVFGPYTTRMGIDTGSNVEVEYRWLNWTGTEYQVITEMMPIQKQYTLLWNSTTNIFETYYGYSYSTYPYDTYVPDARQKEITVYEPITDDVLFYDLNPALCSVQSIGSDLVVEFVGHFTDLMPKTGSDSYLQFNEEVIGFEEYDWYHPDTYSEDARQTENEYQMAKQITIESPVTIARILNEDGTEPDGYLFSVDQGQNFMVRGRLQGGASVANDIDAVQFTLEAWDGFWTEDESRWSSLIYEIIYNLDGTYSINAFNMTEKRNVTYGTYTDWIKVNYTVTDVATGETRIVIDWVETEVEGYQEQSWYYNQITQEWQQNWIEYRSAETRVPTAFGTVGSLTNWTSEGDLYVSFLVNLDESVPETEYWWNFAFMNDTWYQDYASVPGDYEVLSWGQEWVYSFDYQTEKMYVDSLTTSQLSFYNPILNANEGTDYLKGEDLPYILINGVAYPIKVRNRYDAYSGTTEREIFFYDHWDPTTEKDIYRYELENGTKIFVTYTEASYIYNVTANGESFLTAQNYARCWYDGSLDYYYWIDLEGGVHQGDWATYGDPFVTKVFYDVVEIDNTDCSYYVRYGTDGILQLIDYWYWDYDRNRYYMTDINLNTYPVIEKENGHLALIDGSWVPISWPENYFIGEYRSEEIWLSTDVNRYWFTTFDGVEYEMPYPEANAQDWLQMSRSEGDGGLVPTIKTVRYLGKWYPTNDMGGIYNVKIDGTVYDLGPAIDRSYARVNGTEYWDLINAGYITSLGSFDENLQFGLQERVIFDSSYPHSDGNTNYLTAINGTSYIVNETYLSFIYEYGFKSSSFYSTQQNPHPEIINNVTF